MSDRVIHGSWAKYEDSDSGWRTFFIDIPGKDYPVRVSTKKEDVIEAAMALRDQAATFSVTEKEADKINEKTGKPFVNRYLNSVLAGSVGEATGAAVTASAGGGGTGGQGEFQRDLSPEAQKRIEQFQLRELKGVAWQSTAAVFSGSLEEASSAEATTRLFSQMKLLQQLVFSDIAGDVLTPKEGEDIPF